MSPLRWDVLLAGFVLSLPVLALGMRGDLTIEEVTTRLCGAWPPAGAAVALLRLASTPRTTAGPKPRPAARPGDAAVRGQRADPRPLTDPACSSGALFALWSSAGLPEPRTTPQSGRPQASLSPPVRRAPVLGAVARHRRRVTDRRAAHPTPPPPRRVRDGWSDDELGRLVRIGELGRLRRGAYVNGVLPVDAASVHRLLDPGDTRRPAPTGGRESPVSGRAARTAPVGRSARSRARHPPPAGLDGSQRGALRSRRPTPGRRDHGVRRRAGHRPPSGLPWTWPVRYRTRPPSSALDAALHRPAADHDVLRTRLFDIAGTPGSRSAARAVPFADGRSESVGESRSRVILHPLGSRPVGAAVRGRVRRRGRHRPCRLRVGGTRRGRRVRRAGQVRPPAPAGQDPGTPCSRRSAGRTPSATRAGASSAGSGRTCTCRTGSPRGSGERSSAAAAAAS